MKVEFIDVEYKNLHMQQEDICYPDLDSVVAKFLQDYSRSVTGIIIIKDGDKVVTAKFTFSPLGNDGSVQFVNFNDRYYYNTFAKISIQAYAISKALKAKSK